jgi:class 3 adenylate cyclase
VIERDGDYYGRTVNLASRLSGIAGPGEIVLNEAASTALAPERLTALPPAAVKGLDARIAGFRLEPAGRSVARRP